MSAAFELLGLITMLLFVVCWPWGIASVVSVTKNDRGAGKLLWRVAAVFIPIGGFLLFALVRAVRRRRHGDHGTRLTWKSVAAHVLVLLLGVTGHSAARSAAVLRVSDRVPRDYREEWWFVEGGREQPELCLAMSGGGIRSAAFNIGVLRALHENGLLKRVNVISAVSGGSYALSWFLLQQFYGQKVEGQDREKLLNLMFEPEGASQ